MTLRLIAGRGSSGPEEGPIIIRGIDILQGELLELQKHLGKRVVLAGGGGAGSHIATLDHAEMTEMNANDINHGHGLKVFLSDIKPPLFETTIFNPWVDSWKIYEPLP
jgi:hypothetical protein